MGVPIKRLAATAFVIVAMCLAAHVSKADPCQTESTGIDTTLANCHSTVELGEAFGQSFFARDTLVSAITVWREYYDTPNDSIWHMYVMALDSAGRPDVTRLIADGPTQRIIDGDGVNNTPFRFVFDPPLSLPSPGEYEFAIQGD